MKHRNKKLNIDPDNLNTEVLYSTINVMDQELKANEFEQQYSTPSKKIEEAEHEYEDDDEYEEESEEKQSDVSRFHNHKGTPKPIKRGLDYYDYQEDRDEIDKKKLRSDLDTSNPYSQTKYFTQDISACFIETRDLEHVASRSSNTTTVLSTTLVNNNFSTPSKLTSQNTTVVSPPSASSSDSMLSKASTVSTTVGYNSDCDTTQFMGILSNKSSYNTVNMVFSRVRFPTALGKQEDHNTSYELFLRFCASQAIGYKIRDIPYVLSAACSGIATRYEVSVDIDNELKSLQQHKHSARSLQHEYLREFTLKGIRNSQIEVVQKFIGSLAMHYNTQKSVVHFKTDNKGSKEGAKISAALASLKLLDEFNDIKLKQGVNINDMILFAKECLVTNGRLVRGMYNIYGNNIKKIRSDFNLPFNVLENNKEFNSELVNKLVFDLNNASQNCNLIGSLIEDCFDFPKKQYKCKGRKKANKIAVELDDLRKAADVAIIMTTGSFPYVDINNAIPSFLDNVSKNQGWNLSQEAINSLTNSIRDSVNNWNSSKKTVLDSRSIVKTQEITSAHIALNEGIITKQRKKWTKRINTNTDITPSDDNSSVNNLNGILGLEVQDDTVTIPTHTEKYQTRSKNLKKSLTK